MLKYIDNNLVDFIQNNTNNKNIDLHNYINYYLNTIKIENILFINKNYHRYKNEQKKKFFMNQKMMRKEIILIFWKKMKMIIMKKTIIMN